MDKPTRPLGGKEQPTHRPAVGERVIVRCPGFRCLAYLDAKGKWRDANKGTELPEVLEVLLQF